MIFCAVCYYDTRMKRVRQAVTMISGTAVCDEHIGYAQDASFTRIIGLLRDRDEAHAGN